MSLSPRLLLCAVAALLLTGCPGAGLPEGARPTYKTTVTVTYNGAPVEGATVAMVDAGTPPAPSYGLTDAQGVAVMKTNYAEGAVVGSHQVWITKQETVGGAPQADQDSPEYDPYAADVPTQIKYLLPQKYASRTTSGLTAEVTTSGPNEFKFDLTD
jgi:hypothetical protein